ncbi:translation elongation factor Ts [Skermanella mucosa]|uniref:translation elongation factor Ts n=1 Tax=Skermanella mucosa TaxID=1789672 RepID=UPI00192CA31D|nr:translation elongation factor Ts [Skermanella mucosa]UEM23900.1 translation elongation factor Ts [Skermanella mucosa]
MAEITASLVKELREKTGAGMMDCKKALTETSGDLEGAVDWLRKKGLAAAAKKAGRVAAEGLVAVATSDTVGAAVEVNSETDFVARNDRFQAFANQVAQLALEGDGTIEALQQQAFPGTDRNVADEVTNMVATIGENMNLRRVSRIAVGQGAVASYVHNALAPNLGKIGVLVGLESTGDRARLLELGKQIAMHIAAARPEAVNIEDVDASSLERERSVLADQARASGKPEDIIAKMVEGRLRKYYEEVVLLEQVYVIDGENKVRKVVDAVAKEIGAPIKVVGFTRFVLGEGIEKEQSDFAAEVAAQANVGR